MELVFGVVEPAPAPQLSRALRMARGQRFGSESDGPKIRLALIRFVGNFFCLRRKVTCSFWSVSLARLVFFHRDVDLLQTLQERVTMGLTDPFHCWKGHARSAECAG